MDLKLVVESLGDREVKLSWSTREPDWDADPFTVDRANLLRAAEDVRQELRDITNHALDAQRRGQAPDFLARLEPLRSAGAVLFGAIFDAQGGDREQAREVRRTLQEHARRVVAGESAPVNLAIVLRDDGVLIPWSFIFDADAAPEAAAEAAAGARHLGMGDFRGFWLSQFHIRQRLSGLDRLPDMPRSTPAFRGLHIVNEQLFADAMDIVRARGNAASHVREVFGQQVLQVSLVRDWAATREEWARSRDVNDSLVFVFGHSDGETLELGAAPAASERRRYAMSSAAFRELIRKDNGSSASICFLNACRSAAPDPRAGGALFSASFLKATRQKGFHGFIGTEAEVGNADSLEYASAFLYHVYAEGFSVGEAFDALTGREDLLPFNLYYSCFALPEFRIPKPEPVAAGATPRAPGTGGNG